MMLKEKPEPNAVVLKAFVNACKELGIKSEQASRIIGVDRATLSRNKNKGFDPNSKTGELCLQLVRAYRSLFAIAGGDHAFMRHWFNAHNTALSGKPCEMVLSIIGLMRVNGYLDAMRGKV
jgi:hypothetical protein